MRPVHCDEPSSADKVLDPRFHGRAAHAGMAPEDGRSAIAAAARAIADFRLGRRSGTGSRKGGGQVEEAPSSARGRLAARMATRASIAMSPGERLL
jgi:metal-dependent amidase/aminoacylase/carboxypeptidase family protein